MSERRSSKSGFWTRVLFMEPCELWHVMASWVRQRIPPPLKLFLKKSFQGAVRILGRLPIASLIGVIIGGLLAGATTESLLFVIASALLGVLLTTPSREEIRSRDLEIVDPALRRAWYDLAARHHRKDFAFSPLRVSPSIDCRVMLRAILAVSPDQTFPWWLFSSDGTRNMIREYLAVEEADSSFKIRPDFHMHKDLRKALEEAEAAEKNRSSGA